MLIKRDISLIKDYMEDSSNLKNGYAKGLFLPENGKELNEVLKEAQSTKEPLTISGGKTGTTGGCIPFGGWLLGMEKFDKILDFDKKSKTAKVEPGVMLKSIQELAKKEGLLYPPDPTENTSFIGGNAATNASGARSFKFGSTRDWIKGLKVMLANGDILHLKRGKESKKKIEFPSYRTPGIKCSAGYCSKDNMDLIDLFIGSEGTLGIITEIDLSLTDEFFDTFDVISFFDSEEKAINFVSSAKKEKDLITIEFFDENSLKLLRPDYKNIPKNSKSAVYIETEIKENAPAGYIEKWGDLLEKHGSNLEDSWLGTNEKQKEFLRDFRHSMPEHINNEFKKHNTIKYASDIAVPDDKFLEMLNFYNSRLKENSDRLLWVKFGHIGQNHLHVNLVPKTQNDLDLAKNIIMEFVKKGISLGGTCSAEHGIGKIKHPYLREMYGDAGIKEMVRIKKEFDPVCILNQGNIFPKENLFC